MNIQAILQDLMSGAVLLLAFELVFLGNEWLLLISIFIITSFSFFDILTILVCQRILFNYNRSSQGKC